jgi:esterase/lipase superfamily enzyme
MYVVTNRDIRLSKTGLDQFGSKPNRLGPNELRFAEVNKEGKGWQVKWLDDKLSSSKIKSLKSKFKLDIDETRGHYASLEVACGLAEKSRKNETNVMFFVHGFNNDIESVLKRAEEFQKLYKVEVIPFSWPSNGGGVKGVVSYKSDKRDARSSTGALERMMAKVGDYLDLISRARRNEIRSIVEAKCPLDREKQNVLYSKLLEKDCPFKVNILFHSMGNYLYKSMLKSSITEGNKLVFDNVMLVAADTNSKNHIEWVDKIRCRRRCYITINENDQALAASRAKFGDQQLARLGHYVRNLNSRQVYYINLTDASWVRDSHSYFESAVVKKNTKVFKFFDEAVNGKFAEKKLKYQSSGNYYEI